MKNKESKKNPLTEEEKFLYLMNELGIKVDSFDEPQYIYTKALEYGAVVEHCIKRTNFSFDKDGKFIGHSDESSNSFNKRGSTKNE